MYKGRYVAVIEYDFEFDPSQPNARPVEQVQESFRSGIIEQEIRYLMNTEVFPPEMGKCKVTQALFDMYEAPKEDDYD